MEGENGTERLVSPLTARPGPASHFQVEGGGIYLAGHDLSVDTTDLNSSPKTSLVVGVHDVPPPSFVYSNSAIIRTLRDRFIVVNQSEASHGTCHDNNHI